MGEKLLAQRALAMLREMAGRESREAAAALDWAADQRDWLWSGRTWADGSVPAGLFGRGAAGDILDWDTLPRLLAAIDAESGPDELFASVGAASDLLDLGAFDRALLETVAAFERLPRLAALRNRLSSAGAAMAELLGRMAGALGPRAAAQVRRSDAVSLGLLCLNREPGYGAMEVQLHWRFAHVLDESVIDEARLVDVLAGKRQPARLEVEDFREHAPAVDLLVRLLKGGLAQRARGVNILVHGPPGTGKTELARTLAEAAGAELFAVGEADCEGEEPTRSDRVEALQRAQRLFARRGRCVLLFDEMEDLFDEADARRRSGSKVFVNRLLEEGAVPVIWTSNAASNMDRAHLRRMSFVLHMDHPTPKARTRVAEHAAAAEGVSEAVSGLAPLLAREPESASIARAALRTAALAGGGAPDAEATGRSLLLGLRGGRALPPTPDGSGLDLSLYEAETGIAELLERVAAPDAPADFSLLLTGPPGTGKTALAAHLAERLDRPLRVKRASDLLSKWLGETEANIASAFAEARDEGAVLLFDEADSLLLDRADAQRSWEITQVNELLTWMDSHPLPFIAATNFARRLDPAALRRFVFKVELRPLSAESAARAYVRFFGDAAPAALAEIGGLTPGDFAVVKRQLRYRGAAPAAEIVALLAAEARAKPERPVKIGF